MLCSVCSKPVRPVVAIDIDGTLADYHGSLLRFAEEWLGRGWSGPVYDGSEHFRDWFARTFEVDASTFRMIKLAYRQGGMKRTMPVYDGAARLLRDAREAGAEVWVTTTRPHERYDRVDPDTVEWLRRNRIPYDGLLFHQKKMDALKDLIDPDRVAFVLDDQLDVLDAARRNGWKSVLRINAYNRSLTWPTRVGDLDSALRELQAAVATWQERNHS